MADLDTLLPTPVELTLGGVTITLTPLKVGQLPAFLRAINPVLPLLTAGDVDWLDLLGRYGDDLLQAAAIAAGKPREWVDDLAADEALLLVAKVIEVNADFFTRTVLPRLEGLFNPAHLGNSPMNVAGSTLSSN